MTANKKPVTIRKSDLRKWIGLSTNIAPLPDAEFDRHIRKIAKTHRKNMRREHL